MTALLMPDVELLVMDCLLDYLPQFENHVFTTPPTDWADLLPFLAISWKGGATTRWPERLQVTDVQVKAYVTSRREGSDVFRLVDQALTQACLDHYTNKNIPGADPPGVLCHTKLISPAGLEYEGLTSKHPDSALFEGVFRITSAPVLSS